MHRLDKAVQVSAGHDRFGKPLPYVVGEYFHCKLSAADTGGNLCIYDTIRMKKGGPPLHYHHDQDEWFFEDNMPALAVYWGETVEGLQAGLAYPDDGKRACHRWARWAASLRPMRPSPPVTT